MKNTRIRKIGLRRMLKRRMNEVINRAANAVWSYNHLSGENKRPAWMLTNILEGSIYHHYSYHLSLDWSKAEWVRSHVASSKMSRVIDIPFVTVPFRFKSDSHDLRLDVVDIVNHAPFGMRSFIRHPQIGVWPENGKILAKIQFPYPSHDLAEKVPLAMHDIDQWLDVVREEIAVYKSMRWDIVIGIVEDILEDRFTEIYEVNSLIKKLSHKGVT